MLRLEEVSVTRNGRPLLHRISQQFQSGCLYGLVGPNGAGKSTLFRALSGVWPLSSGTVWWHDERLTAQSAERVGQVIALMPQSPTCPFDFSVGELVAMGRYARSGYRRSVSEKEWVYAALSRVGAEHLYDRAVTELSCGERQRVYLARCLATNNPVLLLDEPTSSLDIRHQLELWELLQDLVAEDRVIIAAVHDIALAQRYCDEIALMDNGTLVGCGPFNEVLNEECLQAVFGVSRQEIPAKVEWFLAQ